MIIKLEQKKEDKIKQRNNSNNNNIWSNSYEEKDINTGKYISETETETSENDKSQEIKTRFCQVLTTLNHSFSKQCNHYSIIFGNFFFFCVSTAICSAIEISLRYN